MKYFFWNTNKQKVNEYIKELMLENNYDIIALAEYEDNIKNILSEFKKHGINMYNIKTPGCQRVKLITKIKPENIEYCSETEYYTIKILNLNYDKKQILVIVHMPSKLYAGDEVRRIELEDMVKNVKTYESQYKTKNTVIMGDFNANPFEGCMIYASGLHALSDSSLYKPKYSRCVKKRTYDIFYNPMWNKFGDFDEAPGTYYYGKSEIQEYFWNIFDQVIIRPQIASYFLNDSLKIITKVKDKLLLKNRKIVIGDHLPIEFIIEEE